MSEVFFGEYDDEMQRLAEAMERYYANDRHEDGLMCALRMLEIAMNILPDNSPNFVILLSNVGVSFDKLGDFEEAQKYHLLSLEALEKASFPDDKNDMSAIILGARVVICDFYTKWDRYEDALRSALRVLEFAKNTIPDDSQVLMVVHCNTGVYYDKLGKFEEARAHHLLAIDALQRVPSPDNEDVINVHLITGNFNEKWEQYEDALLHKKIVLEIIKNDFPSSHLSIAQLCDNIGFLNYKLDRLEDALYYLNIALETFEDKLHEYKDEIRSLHEFIGNI